MRQISLESYSIFHFVRYIPSDINLSPFSSTTYTDGYHYQQSKLENRQWEESGERGKGQQWPEQREESETDGSRN